MHPIRVSDSLLSPSTSETATESHTSFVDGGYSVPRDLFIREPRPEGDDQIIALNSITVPGVAAGVTRSSVSSSKRRGDNDRSKEASVYASLTSVCCGNKAQSSHFHRHSPVTSKEVMKTINNGAASYLSHSPKPRSSTTKMVDQALNVVQSKGTLGMKNQVIAKSQNILFGDESQSSHATCSSATLSASNNSTASSSIASHSDHPLSSAGKVGPSETDTHTAEPNMIAPALKKIVKKRRKEPDPNGLERSSFHHTKSSKEYLRKAQEALRRQKEQTGSSTEISVTDSLSSSDSLHSPRTNFRVLCQSSVPVARMNVVPTPLSKCQSCSGTGAIEDSTYGQTTYGYQVPDANGASNSNPYGYEDPDAKTSKIIPDTCRMDPARRRGSVTKYSLHAAQAAQKATERIMRLQGLNWNRGNGVASSCRDGSILRPNTSTGRPPESSQPLSLPVRRRSIPMDDWDQDFVRNDAMETSDPRRCESTQMDEKPDYPAIKTSKSSTNSRPYGCEGPDAASVGNMSIANPYGYGDDTSPRPPAKSHPRARRRGSVTKFSLDVAKTLASSGANSGTEKQPRSSMLADAEDFVIALKPPACGRDQGHLTKNLRRLGLGVDSADADNNGSSHQLRRNKSSGSDHLSPCRSAPRRKGSARSSNTPQIARFSAPCRSDSFLSHGSNASWEDDADSLAPDMESLCSIHERGDLGMDHTPIPQVTGVSPIVPGLTPGTTRKSMVHSFSGMSDSGKDRIILENRKSFNERTNVAIVSFPKDADFAVLPFPASGSDSRSSARMPAPPIRRSGSNTSYGHGGIFHINRHGSTSESSVSCRKSSSG